MAPKYKLTYFHSRGYAEIARLILAHAEIEYEDIRINYDEWPALKPKQPFGQLPSLEVDGQLLSETAAIYAFLATEHGLAGKSNFEAARCAMILDALKDVFIARSKYYLEKDEAQKEELRKALVSEIVPLILNQLEKILRDNGGTYVVGTETTYADLAITFCLGELKNLIPNMLDNHKALQSLTDRVNSIPSIKKWIERRPVTQF